MADIKIVLTRRAVEQRVSRAMQKKGVRLKKLGETHAFGPYAEVNGSGDRVLRINLSLERLAKDLKVLKPYEEIEC